MIRMSTSKITATSTKPRGLFVPIFLFFLLGTGCRLVNGFTLVSPHLTTKFRKTYPATRKNVLVAPLPVLNDPIITSVISKKEEISALEAIFPFINHFFLSPYKLREMIHMATSDVSQISRLVGFAIIGYILPYIGRFSRNFLSMGKIGNLLHLEPVQYSQIDKKAHAHTTNSNYGSINVQSSSLPDYNTTKWYHIFNHLTQGFYLGAVNSVVDCLLDSTEALGVHSDLVTVMSNAFTSASFTIWAMFRMRCYKNLLIDVLTKRKSKHVRQIWKETTNYILYVITFTNILNLMGLKYSIAIRAISAFGGIGTLVFGLACKEIAAQLVGGLVFAVQRPFITGDTIMYGNKDIIGRVESVGFMYTSIRESDEVRVKIPNSELTSKTVSNLSQEKRSQVLQKLQFTYDTLDSMPELVSKIKHEIESSCPKLIKNGSSPWRVYFNSYNKGHLEVVVDARFRVQPYSNEYYDIKEQVMIAIGKATKSCNVQFKY